MKKWLGSGGSGQGGCEGVRLNAALGAEVLNRITEVQRRPRNCFSGLIHLVYLLKIGFKKNGGKIDA